MANRNKKIEKDFLDIEDFSLSTAKRLIAAENSASELLSDHAPAKKLDSGFLEIKTSSAIKKQPSGKEVINQLILQEIEDLRATESLRREKKVLKSAAKRDETALQTAASRVHKGKTTSRPSRYVVDLRKSYLIEKHRLHSFDVPRESWTASTGSLFRAWKQKLDDRRESNFHWPGSEESIPKKKRVKQKLVFTGKPSAVGIFSFAMILVIVLAPVSLLMQVNSLVAAKNDLTSKTQNAFSLLQSGMLDLAGGQYAQANDQLASAKADFESANKSLEQYDSVLIDMVKLVPSLGKKVELAQESTSFGNEVTEFAQLLSTSLQSKNNQTITDTLLALSQHLSRLQPSLKKITTLLAATRGSDIPLEYQPKLQYLIDNSGTIDSLLTRLNSVILTLYSIAGGTRDTRYLIVFQNNRELRPTGGFVGSYALASMHQGSLQHIEFPGAGSYQLQGGLQQLIEPPQPLSLLQDRWFFWDANWWPDFPTSARKLMWFYTASGGNTVDGVIAINSDFVQHLISVTGPVSLPNYGVVIDSDNFYATLQSEVELNYDKTENQPKKILSEMMPLLLDRLYQTNNYRDLLTLMLTALNKKDVQIYLSDADLEQQINNFGWDGSLKDSPRDYLQVTSTNVGGGKSDQNIFETIDHHAIVDANGSIVVTTKITKENRAQRSDYMGYVNNVDYMRIYVPQGSVLRSATGFQQPEQRLFKASNENATQDPSLSNEETARIDETSGTKIYDESHHTVFGNWVQVAPGEHKVVSLTYKLPFHINIGSDDGVSWLLPWTNQSEVDGYSLLVQRQSGANNVILNSSVSIDPVYKLVWSDAVQPENLGYSDQTATYVTDLDQDTYYALLLASARHE